MKEHAGRSNIWDKSQLGNCSGVLGTVDQLIIDNAIIDKVRNQQINLAVAFYNYQKAYNMVQHNWMISGSMDRSSRESCKSHYQTDERMEDQNGDK